VRRLELRHRDLQLFENYQADEIQRCTTVNKDVVQLDVDDCLGDEQQEMPDPTMRLGQSKASKLIDVSIHLWCDLAFGTGAAAATSRRMFLMMRREVMSQELPNMT
jgi:hypothetical protein